MASTGCTQDSPSQQQELATSSLVTETERRMLELVARGAPLSEALDTLTEAIERISPESLCTIMLLDEEQRRRLLMASGPSLPTAYLEAVNGLEIGPEVGACGSAAFRNETVIVRDTATDPRFAGATDLVLSHGLRSCWSQPIRDSRGEVLGTFAVYRRQISDPRPDELRLARVAGQLAGNTIERTRAEKQLGDAIKRLKLAETVARFGIWEADFHQNVVTLSAGLAVLLEQPPARLQLTREEFAALVHPEDRNCLWAGAQQQALPARTQQDEFRLVLPSGTVRWMRSHWSFEESSSGRPSRATGAMLDITTEKEMYRQLSFRAQYDSLTSLLNRASLYERLEGLMRAGGGHALGVIYLDLDGFKEINDTSGHAAGDEVLKYVAGRIAASVRRSDAVARIGGDEFVMVVPSVADRDEVTRIANMIEAGITGPVKVDGKTLLVGASLGIALYPEDGADPDALLKVADQRMYQAKLAQRTRPAAPVVEEFFPDPREICA